jgi:hypothetical protein
MAEPTREEREKAARELRHILTLLPTIDHAEIVKAFGRVCSVRLAATIAGVSTRTLDEVYIKPGRLPVVRLGKRRDAVVRLADLWRLERNPPGRPKGPRR